MEDISMGVKEYEGVGDDDGDVMCCCYYYD